MFGKSVASARCERALRRRALAARGAHEDERVLRRAAAADFEGVGSDEHGHRLAEEPDEVLLVVDPTHEQREPGPGELHRQLVAHLHAEVTGEIVGHEHAVVLQPGGAPAHEPEVDDAPRGRRGPCCRRS